MDEAEVLEERSEVLPGVEKLLSLCSTGSGRRVVLGIWWPLGIFVDVVLVFVLTVGMVTIREQCRTLSKSGTAYDRRGPTDDCVLVRDELDGPEAERIHAILAGRFPCDPRASAISSWTPPTSRCA